MRMRQRFVRGNQGARSTIRGRVEPNQQTAAKRPTCAVFHTGINSPTLNLNYGATRNMTNLEMSRILFLLVALVSSTIADPAVVKWRPCPQVNADAPSECTIHEVRVDPCAEAASGKPCRIKRGREASISFDFTPNFSASTLTSQAYWATNIDIAFTGMNTDGCTQTTCPVTAGTKQTYTYSLPIARSYPARDYDLKWTLSNPENKQCCFLFKIKIYK